MRRRNFSSYQIWMKIFSHYLLRFCDVNFIWIRRWPTRARQIFHHISTAFERFVPLISTCFFYIEIWNYYKIEKQNLRGAGGVKCCGIVCAAHSHAATGQILCSINYFDALKYISRSKIKKRATRASSSAAIYIVKSIFWGRIDQH